MRSSNPVALDPDYAVWQAFANMYWPALYIADAEGKIRHHQFGEGGYAECEMVIQDGCCASLAVKEWAAAVGRRRARRRARRAPGQANAADVAPAPTDSPVRAGALSTGPRAARSLV